MSSSTPEPYEGQGNSDSSYPDGETTSPNGQGTSGFGRLLGGEESPQRTHSTTRQSRRPKGPRKTMRLPTDLFALIKEDFAVFGDPELPPLPVQQTSNPDVELHNLKTPSPEELETREQATHLAHQATGESSDVPDHSPTPEMQHILMAKMFGFTDVGIPTFEVHFSLMSERDERKLTKTPSHWHSRRLVLNDPERVLSVYGKQLFMVWISLAIVGSLIVALPLMLLMPSLLELKISSVDLVSLLPPLLATAFSMGLLVQKCVASRCILVRSILSRKRTRNLLASSSRDIDPR